MKQLFWLVLIALIVVVLIGVLGVNSASNPFSQLFGYLSCIDPSSLICH